MTQWKRALVTGASSGIGEAIARQLAADGTDLVITARNEERLQRLAAELSERDVEVIPADLGDSSQLAVLTQRLADDERPVDLLVNNAGFGFQGDFIDLDLEGEMSVIDVNVVAVARLAHTAGVAMAARGGGGIINIASIAGLMSSAGTATYGATKAFVVNFGEALHMELAPLGVKVTTVCPGFTRTEFQDRAGFDASSVPNFLWQTADEVAEASLTGVDKSAPRVVPGLPNKMGVGAAKLLPSAITRRVSGMLTKD